MLLPSAKWLAQRSWRNYESTYPAEKAWIISMPDDFFLETMIISVLNRAEINIFLVVI